MIKAIIFDMDGLMIDSEPSHLLASNKVFQNFNVQLSEEENSRYIGLPDIDMAKDIVVRYSFPISPQELVKRKQAEFRSILDKGISVLPGLMQLLEGLKKKKFKIGIASSSVLVEIKAAIKGLKIEKYFGTYASAEEVKKGKPSPDVYLLAAKRLKIDPKDCLVLEDAPSGVKAGKAAGMTVFAIPSQYTKGKDFSQADKVLQNLTEVFPLISAENNA